MREPEREDTMKERNRFSSLLKHLMTVAKLKNYTLAKELQYDESYISKWVTGVSLPTEKNYEKVLQGISHCIVETSDEDGIQALMEELELENTEELERAMYYNLEAEYLYVTALKETTGSEIAPRTAYFPELTLAQFLDKMHHPVLRRVKELDVVSAMDILSLDRHYQLALAQLDHSENVVIKNYPGVSFSMLINLEGNRQYNTYNVSFIINLLSNLTDLNFKLYSCPQAVGKLIFAVRDAYSIGGMLIDENHCMGVTTSEEVENCNAIYNRLASMCSCDQLLVRKTTMEDMLESHEYVKALFARNQRWMIGHLTEHFLPDDLFEELAVEYCSKCRRVSIDSLRKTHNMCHNVLREGWMKIIGFENALADFTVSGELDFYNRRMFLTVKQRVRYLEHLQHLLNKNKKVEIKLLHSNARNDFQHVSNPNLFLADSMCYLRLRRSDEWNSTCIVNRADVSDMFLDFFDEIWNSPDYPALDGVEALKEVLTYSMEMARVQLESES